MLLSFSVLSPPSTFFLEVEGATDDDLSREDDNDELSPLDLNDDVVYLRLVVDSENLVSVTAMVVPVDLPGENVIVSGTLLVVERTDSEDTEEVVPSEDDPDDMDVVLCRLRLPEEVKSDDDDDVTVIGVVVGIDGNPDELEVGTCTSDTLVDDSNDDDDDDIDRLSLIEDIVEDDISSDETADDDRPIEDDFTVSVDSLTNDEVAIRVLSVKLSVGDRVRYDVENELSDIVTVDGLAVGTSDIETLEELELSTVEDDSSKEDDFEVNKLWLLEMSLLLEDAPDSVVSLAELMVDDVLGLDDESGLVVDTSKEDDLT